MQLRSLRLVLLVRQQLSRVRGRNGVGFPIQRRRIALRLLNLKRTRGRVCALPCLQNGFLRAVHGQVLPLDGGGALLRVVLPLLVEHSNDQHSPRGSLLSKTGCRDVEVALSDRSWEHGRFCVLVAENHGSHLGIHLCRVEEQLLALGLRGRRPKTLDHALDALGALLEHEGIERLQLEYLSISRLQLDNARSASQWRWSRLLDSKVDFGLSRHVIEQFVMVNEGTVLGESSRVDVPE